MPQSPERLMRRLGLGGVLGLLLSATASAQTDAASAMERQTNEAFRQVLQQPQDLGLWSRYAQLLVQAGNYEGGIAALERLLLEPNASPELRLEIALLYYRLGSYAMAEGMVREALGDSRLQGDKRNLAETLLVDTTRRNQRSQFGGSATLGLRHQSNPGFRSDSAQVLSGGLLGPPASNQRPEGDTDLNLGLRLQHAYDLERQNSAAIASTLAAYLANYRSSSGHQLQANPTKPYDLQVLEVTTGLQFKPLPATQANLSLRPHLLLSNVAAQGHQYLRNQGLGLDLHWRPDERTLLELTADGQDRDFANRIDVTNADQLDGRLYGLRMRVVREVGVGRQLAGEYALRRNRAGRDYYDFTSHEVRVTYAVTYASPLRDGRYWTTGLSLGALRRTYGAPDPSITLADTRRDREWRVAVNQTLQLTPVWYLLLMAEHSRNQANLPNFRYKNTSFSGAVLRTF
ncbi:MAG TPA: tetratricopeptide repeat protein [Burkholderiaceae bacterium]|nr:tetratricopeptide repeat protein [Burkholderiaceae bacterium]